MKSRRVGSSAVVVATDITLGSGAPGKGRGTAQPPEILRRLDLRAQNSESALGGRRGTMPQKSGEFEGFAMALAADSGIFR